MAIDANKIAKKSQNFYFNHVFGLISFKNKIKIYLCNIKNLYLF